MRYDYEIKLPSLVQIYRQSQFTWQNAGDEQYCFSLYDALLSVLYNLQQQMGNQNAKGNDDFSKNPNFNLQAHQQAMNRINSNYRNEPNNMQVPNQPHYQAKTQQTHLRQVQRSCYIFKNSISIKHDQQKVYIDLEYSSQNGNILEVYIGIIGIQQDEHQRTVKIDSMIRYTQQLQATQKLKIHKQYPIQGHQNILSNGIVLRMVNKNEITQYSLRIVANNQWKVLLQKFQMNGQVTQLVNIYKGEDSSNQCIVCLTNPANTLIQPCNHLCLCAQCLPHIQQTTNNCPICRSNILKFKTIMTQ